MINRKYKTEISVLEDNLVLENPLVRNFLKDEENYHLVKVALNVPNLKNIRRVDDKFREYWRHVKLVSYISKLIHYFSIDYNKSLRRVKNKSLLIFDEPLNTDKEGSFTWGDTFKSANCIPFEKIYGHSLKDHIAGVSLYSGLLLLTPNQLEIIELIYFKNLPIKEIAKIKETSPQNISNHHRRALKTLKSHLMNGE